MGLTLLTGPAHAGKVAHLLDRYLESLPEDPILIVPNRPDVERVERDLLRRRSGLVGGWIGTFDDLFERIARGNGGHRPVLSAAQRALLLRRVVGRARLDALATSSRFGGFADALGTAVAELASGLIEPAEVEGELGELFRAYREALDRLGTWDRELERAYAVDRIAGELEAWQGAPVFAYGFEDLTGAQWALLRALAGRVPVTVSLPYEPGRPSFSSLARTAEDLASLSDGRIEELPPRYGEWATESLAHLERGLHAPVPPAPAALDGSIRFLEGAGARGTLELVADEILALVRAGTGPGEIGVVCPSLERLAAPLQTAFAAAGIPFGVEGRVRLAQTSLGSALLALLAFEWRSGGRRELYAFLRSPYSGLARTHVDYLEGRLRGRGVVAADRVEEETTRLRGHPLPALRVLREASSPTLAVRTLVRSMLRGAHGLEAPPSTEAAHADLEALAAVTETLDELDEWSRLGDGGIAAEDVVAALERTSVRLPGGGDPDRVAVLDLLRARTRELPVVFVLGLEEGSLPRRESSSPFLSDEVRATLESPRTRLRLPPSVERDRYLFYTACTRATRRLYLVREAATEDGATREPSPFWTDVRGLFEPESAAAWTRRRPLAALTWPLEAAPTERERLRAVAALAATDVRSARAVARANGWERRLERALSAFDRPTRLVHPAVLAGFRERSTFGVTELEAFADCSSIWLIDRVLSPKTIDARVDARLRGQVAHTTLHRFFAGLPKRLGSDRVLPERLEEALAFLRECVDEAVGGVRLELAEVERAELAASLRQDLEHVIRDEAATTGLVPRRFEVSFGSDRSAPELQRGLDLDGFTLSGKIDRIDVDPFSARGIVQDYKSGKRAHSASQIESELRLQIPLYMLVLRDLVGIEPLGGVYRALSGTRQARGLLRATALEDGLEGFKKNDYLDEEAFWGVVERAKEHARGFVSRIRAGDVAHDPRGGFPCPSWCELAPMCRVRRA